MLVLLIDHRSNVDVLHLSVGPAGSSEQTQTVLRRNTSALFCNDAESEHQLLEQRTSAFSAKHQSPGLEVLSSSLTLRAEPREEPEPLLDWIKATKRSSDEV